MNTTFYTFDDVAIIPRTKSTLESRSEVDLGTNYLKPMIFALVVGI